PVQPLLEQDRQIGPLTVRPLLLTTVLSGRLASPALEGAGKGALLGEPQQEGNIDQGPALTQIKKREVAPHLVDQSDKTGSLLCQPPGKGLAGKTAARRRLFQVRLASLQQCTDSGTNLAGQVHLLSIVL